MSASRRACAMAAPRLRLTPLVAAALALACASGPAAEPAPPALILISLDGFRWDYRTLAATPALDRLAAEGVAARALVPVFPALTFPSHYTVVTGLWPENHGVVSNTMYDPAFDARFSLRSDATRDGRWYGGEPIWVTAAKQGLVTATYFWPGSDAEIRGVRPTHWRRFDSRVPNERRVRQVLAWFDLPPAERPSFVTLYFEDTDNAGHDHGPESPEVAAAIRRLDRLVGTLVEGLARRGLLDRVHIVITSDHGMAALSRDSVIFLDDYVDLRMVRITGLGSNLGLWPDAGREDEIYAALVGAHPRLRAWRRAEMPERLHYRSHRRIPPIVGLVAEGWTLTTRSRFARDSMVASGGTHGYDPALPSMHGIFIARGPRLKRGFVAPAFGSVHIYALLAELLGLVPAPNDGSPDSVRAMLREP